MSEKIKFGVLALTHSSRETDLEECSRKTLVEKYSSPDRLKKILPFENLSPVVDAKLYFGGVSFYLVYKDINEKISFKKNGHIKSERKIQHAIFLDEKRILAVYEFHLELWKLYKPITAYKSLSRKNFYIDKIYDHPHFSGLHTASMVTENLVVLSASAPDAILILDLESGKLMDSNRMPKELYGENYELTVNMDLRKHYIHNQLQTTHINSAYSYGNNILVSALIPGSIGYFNLETKNYVELTSGHIGCHGARVSNEGEIYFTDSTAGKLVFLGEHGNIINEFTIDSKWLHDSLQIEGDIFAFTVADKNELRIVDIKSGNVLYKKKFFTSTKIFNKVVSDSNGFIAKLPFFYGNSTQFLSIFKL
jgi:hypothetical protein